MPRVDPHSVLICKIREMVKLMNIYLNHFPKHEKYALCQEIRNSMYRLYGYVVECEKRYHKKTTLTALDIEHEKLRMFTHISFELGYFGFNKGKNESDELGQKRLVSICRSIDEVGKIIGG